VGKIKEKVVYADNSHDLEALKQNTDEAVNIIQQCEICLKEFRHVLQQRADILNIFYDDEYNINYYI
jgi:hypothetical protein